MKFDYVKEIENLREKLKTSYTHPYFLYNAIFEKMKELELIEYNEYSGAHTKYDSELISDIIEDPDILFMDCSLENVKEILVQFAIQILAEYYYMHSQKLTPEIIHALEKLFLTVFPEGKIVQKVSEFSKFKDLLKDCIDILILISVESENLKVALSLYKDYDIASFNIFSACLVGFFHKKSEQKNEKDTFAKLNISLYDLYTIKDLIASRILPSQELLAKLADEIEILKLLCSSIHELLKKCKDKALEPVSKYIENFYPEFAKNPNSICLEYYSFQISDNINESNVYDYLDDIYNNPKIKNAYFKSQELKRLLPDYSSSSKEIEDLYECIIELENLYPSVQSKIELLKRKEVTKINDVLVFVDKLIAVGEKEEEEKLLNEISNISAEEKRDLVIRFLKCCEECQDSSYGQPYTSYPYVNIDYDALYSKIEKNSAIINILAASQKRFESFKNLNVFGGDFTFMVVNQIKVVERYLKEIIVQHLVGTQIYSSYKNKNTLFDNAKQRKIYEENNGTSCIVVKPTNGIEVLCSKSKNSISIQLATCMHIVSNFFEELRDDGTIEHLDSTFNEKNQAIPTLNTWKSTVRNGYFHVHLVESTKDAIVVHNKTAFCLMRCIFELKGLKR